MLTITGVLALTLSVRNPIATYQLNKFDSPRANSDHVFLHMEKYCPIDALWYPQCMKESLYCKIFWEIMYGVIKTSLDLPERANFFLTTTTILALSDEPPGVDGNPHSARYHCMYLWRELQQAETHGTRPFQLSPQPPR